MTKKLRIELSVECVAYAYRLKTAHQLVTSVNTDNKIYTRDQTAWR